MTVLDEGKAFPANNLTRRSLLKTGGALVVMFSLPVVRAAAATFAPVPSGELDSWISIGADNTITAFTGRIDMGTGVQTVYAQAVAEELEAPVSSVNVVMGDTARTPQQGKSTASNSVTLNLGPMRSAAAEARGMLLDLAAEKFGVPRGDLAVADRMVFVRSQPNRKMSYGELIGGRKLTRKLETKGESQLTEILSKEPLKARADFKVLGKSVPRVDIPDKVAGRFKFVNDVTVPNMAHGVVVLPPAVGATLISVDLPSVQPAGLIKVVTIKNYVAIVADTEQAALRARDSIKVNWAKPEGKPFDDIYRVMREGKVVKDNSEEEVGNVETAFSDARIVETQTFNLPWNCHGMMGPSCAVADYNGDTLTIWSGTQWPDGTRRDIAAMMKLPVENVHLIWVEAAGSYGRLAVDDAAGDAALLSREVGRPVRVQWQRADEHAWSPLNPGAVITVRAGLDGAGTVSGWHFESWTPSHSTGERSNILNWRLTGTSPNYPRLSGAADKPTYEFANRKVVSHYVEEVVRAVYMRSVGTLKNVFAIESMMDILAAKANADPIEFRLRHLKDERMKAVLRAVAEKAKWEPGKLSGGSGDIATGRGVALIGGADKAFRGYGQAYTVTIVDVEVQRRTGQVWVRRAYVGFDTGMIINPDGLRNQIEGGTIMGISRALKEEVTFEGRTVTSSDWNSYPVIGFREIPEAIDIVTLDNEHPPLGAGEPPTITPPAAIANAIYAATKARITTLPLTPERVKEAMKA